MGKGLAGLWMIVLAVTVSACAAPQFTYVSNSADRTYFKVPGGWHHLSDTAVASAFGSGGSGQQTGVWVVGYDGSTVPSIAHLFGQTPQPFTWAFVEKLNPTLSNGLSYNGLRDLYLPVTPTMRQIQAQRGFKLTHFHLLSDKVLTPGQGIHGVREIYDYTFPGGGTDTFDQVALTDANSTEVYLLVTHCLATCYLKHQHEIETVMTSFTVRSQ
jgi:hypothetical protein